MCAFSHLTLSTKLLCFGHKTWEHRPHTGESPHRQDPGGGGRASLLLQKLKWANPLPSQPLPHLSCPGPDGPDAAGRDTVLGGRCKGCRAGVRPVGVSAGGFRSTMFGRRGYPVRPCTCHPDTFGSGCFLSLFSSISVSSRIAWCPPSLPS